MNRRDIEKLGAELPARSAVPRSRLPLILISLAFALSTLWLAATTHPARLLRDPFSGSDHPFKTMHSDDDLYLVGAGKADITGPVVEINMMGYADTAQLGTGLRQRLYSRAFIVGSTTTPEDRFVYLVLDTQSGDTAVRYGILSALSQMGPQYAVYGKHNVALTGTHSHSGPGAWLNYLLPQITSKGFDKQSYEAIVSGAVLSIQRAHESLAAGRLTLGTTKVHNAGINRSLFSYMANPEDERRRYNISAEDDGSVERDMTMLRMRRASDGKDIGVLTWYPTHGTSMLGNNTLISGDNKGVAADLLEKEVRKLDTASADFVAGFSQANMGDVSPNVLGAWCEDGSGEMCDFETSTCADGRSQKCHGRGPHFRKDSTGTASCFEIGRRQSDAAKELLGRLDTDGVPVRGDLVRAFHVFHDMSFANFTLPNGTEVQTCPAALGYSFAAGTSDGPGAFDFTQHGSNDSNSGPVWPIVSRFLRDPSDEQERCQGKKPILLDVGEMHRPYEWTPNIVDVQALRVGQLFVVVSPGEATTMAGRRWKEAVREAAGSAFGDELAGREPVVVLGGPANSYTHYITTEEEYAIQRYESASTLYGPHTLAAYINRTISFLPYLSPSAPINQSTLTEQPYPPDNSDDSLSFIGGVVFDKTPLFKAFGDVLQDVETKYPLGATVNVTFVGANPRNDLRLEGSYATVERKTRPSGRWEGVRDDSDWGLVFRWRRVSEVLGTSEVDVQWETGGDDGASAGMYRIRYFGDWKGVSGNVTPFEGVSGEFRLV